MGSKVLLSFGKRNVILIMLYRTSFCCVGFWNNVTHEKMLENSNLLLGLNGLYKPRHVHLCICILSVTCQRTADQKQLEANFHAIYEMLIVTVYLILCMPLKQVKFVWLRDCQNDLKSLKVSDVVPTCRL